MSLRETCKHRHQTNGNCLLYGGFCTSIIDDICPKVTTHRILTEEDLIVAEMFVEEELSHAPYCNELHTILNVLEKYKEEHYAKNNGELNFNEIIDYDEMRK